MYNTITNSYGDTQYSLSQTPWLTKPCFSTTTLLAISYLGFKRRFTLPYFLGVTHCEGVLGRVSADVGFLTDSDGYRHMDSLGRKENGRVVIHA